MIEIWGIGLKNPDLDKSFDWCNLNSNFNDPDIIIINLRSLDSNVLERIDKNVFKKVRNEIYNNFLNGGTLIFIISESFKYRERKNSKLELKTDEFTNFDLCPIKYHYDNSITNKFTFSNNCELKFYLSKIKESELILYDFMINDYLLDFDSTNRIRKDISHILQNINSQSQDKHHVKIMENIIATDKSNNIISIELWLQINGFWKSGNIYYLPITKVIPIEEGINDILEIHGKKSDIESLPEWIDNIKLPEIIGIENKLRDFQNCKQKIENQIKDEEERKKELEVYYHLLTAKDNSLENSIFKAFNLLGFPEIRKERAENLEDWIVDFSSPTYNVGVIEVKGSIHRTSLTNLTQCNKWVDEYFELKKMPKGIFIPNQCRLEKYPDSQSDRMHFEPNEIVYSEKKDICIIPSCIIFEAITKVLNGKSPNREKIEKQILNTKGVLIEIKID